MINFTKISLLLIALSLIVGCTSMRSVKPYVAQIETKNEIFQNYKLNENKNVYIGDSIIEKGNLKVNIINSGKFKTLVNRNWLSEGSIYNIKFTDNEDGSYYITDRGTIRVDRDGILLNKYGYYYNFGWVDHPGIYIGEVGEKLFSPIENSITYGSDSFKIQIIYAGLDGDNFKVTYREFKNDLARPAFNQDIVYNLNKSKIIRYKNFRIEISNASNEEISYVVLED